MPIDQPLFKCVLSGTISTTQSWSVGLWVQPSAPTMNNQATKNALNSAVAAVWQAHNGDYVNALFGATTKVTHLTSYYWPPNATESNGVSTPAPVTGNGTGDSMPSLLALVVSLRTALPGKSGRGRLYMPVTKVAAMDATGQLNETLTPATATKFADLISDINALTVDGWGDLTCVVASQFLGETNPITSVVVNSMLDIQHRRENSVATATNSSAAVA